MVDSIFAIGLKGIHQGLENAAKDADRVSRAFTPDSNDDALAGIIGLKADLRQVQASSTVIRTGQRLEDSILDILA